MIKAKTEAIRTFGGHMVILGAPGASKPHDRVMSHRHMIVQTHSIIISRAQLNLTKKTLDIVD